MGDLLLNISRNAFARKVVRTAGLPIPLPQDLHRDRAPWVHATLDGRKVAVGTCDGKDSLLKSLIVDAGSIEADGSGKLDGWLFDAKSAVNIADLKALYSFAHSHVGRVKTSGHIVVVGNAVDGKTPPSVVAVQDALTGFVRSLAKELGRKGITVNMIAASETAALGGILRFLLSDHSAFITGQVIRADAGSVTAARFDHLLQERTILVTGAAQGIGAAIARRLAGEGAKIILLDRPQEMTALESMAREVNGIPLPIDLAKDDAAQILMKKLWENAPIHGVIHNAGVTRDKMLARMSEERWDTVLDINLGVPVHLTETMMGREHESLLAKDASFVYLSSVGGIAGNPGQTNYAATKSGLIGYVSALAQHHHATEVRVNAVAPGFIETRMPEAMPLAVREVARRFNSLNQAGEPDDVAQAVMFLVSQAGACINGQVIRVCGQNLIGA